MARTVVAGTDICGRNTRHDYREQMAACKYPRIIEFRDQLPKNSLGKVLKDELARSWLSGRPPRNG